MDKLCGYAALALFVSNIALRSLLSLLRICRGLFHQDAGVPRQDAVVSRDRLTSIIFFLFSVHISYKPITLTSTCSVEVLRWCYYPFYIRLIKRVSCCFVSDYLKGMFAFAYNLKIQFSKSHLAELTTVCT